MTSWFSRWQLALFLRVRRSNPFVLLVMALGVAALTLWWLVIPAQTRMLALQYATERSLRDALSRPPKAPIAAVADPQQLRYDAFRENLGEYAYSEQQLKTYFASAAKYGVVLSQGDYHLEALAPAHLALYRIQLPVKGSYSAIRSFVEDVLITIPFASLDQINFKRDGIAAAQIEAKLSFTLYLNASATNDVASTVNPADPAPGGGAK